MRDINPWEDAKAAFNYNLAREEARELFGKKPTKTQDADLFEKAFGRRRRGRSLYRDY